MKKFIILLFFSLLLVPFAFAQESPDDVARKYGITFPIKELGNCENYAECRTFCEDPLNKDACIAFAKTKGFYKEQELSERQRDLLQAAKTELGCTDVNSCQATCHQEENFDKCDSFAKKHGLSGGRGQDPGKREILEKAKTILGCDSPQSCRNACEKEENREKCNEFVKQTGLRGGETRQGPGGCTSEESCRKFCSDPNNYQICSGFSQGSGGKFVGPGGCNSESSCQAYCQEHPKECGYREGPRPTGYYNPQEMCLRTPSCRWENNSCQCGFYDREGSGQSDQYCSPPSSGCPENLTWDRATCTCKPSCSPGTSWNGNYCMKDSAPYGGGYSSGTSSCPPPSEGCQSGLTWDRGTCTCRPSCPSGTSWDGKTCMTDSAPSSSSGGSGSTSSCPAPASGCGGGMTWDIGTCTCKPSCPSGTSWNGSSCMTDSSSQSNPEEECRKSSNCRWENNSCACGESSNSGSSGSNEQMEACYKQSGCRWEDNTCKCEQVQGITALKRTFADYFFQLFLTLFKGY